MRLYRRSSKNPRRFSKSGCGMAQMGRRASFRFFFSSTISAAHISVPFAIPVIKVTYPSAIALSIAFSKRCFTSFSERLNFSGRCPVKQHLCNRFSFSIINIPSSVENSMQLNYFSNSLFNISYNFSGLCISSLI